MADAGASTDAPVPSLIARAQYIVDLSFENPNAPNSLVPREDPPQVNIGVDVQARRGSESQFEIVLKIGARVGFDDETVFAVELLYGGLFEVENIPEEELQPVLLIECPRLLFPFARAIIANITREGGFPPLMLEPVNFVSLYQQRMAEAAGQAEGQVGHA
jgi:preprotein translocase subunit SecB